MKKCRTCVSFDRLHQSMGICSDTGETVGVNNSCIGYTPDEHKIRAIAKEAAKLYFDYNITAKEALERAKEICK